MPAQANYNMGMEGINLCFSDAASGPCHSGVLPRHWIKADTTCTDWFLPGSPVNCSDCHPQMANCYRQARPNMYILGVQAAGGRVGTPTGSDNSSRAMQRLKDMYARNLPTHENDRPSQPQGVKQLLQVSSNCSVLGMCVANSGTIRHLQTTLLA